MSPPIMGPLTEVPLGKQRPRELTLGDVEQKAFQSGRWVVAVFWVDAGRVNGYAKQSHFPMADYPIAVDQFVTKLVPDLVGSIGRTTEGVLGESPAGPENSDDGEPIKE